MKQIIPTSMQRDLLDSFWMAVGECEAQADNDDDPIVKRFVEGWYRQWNKITGENHEPRWVTRQRKTGQQEQT